MPIFTTSLRPNGGIASGAYGGILQAKLGRNGSHFSTNSTSFVDITNMSVTLTPTLQSSTFLVLVSLGRASTRQSNLDHTCHLRIVRQIGSGSFVETTSLNGEASGSRPPGFGTIGGIAFNDDHSFGPWASVGCDSPNSTSAITYKVQCRVQMDSYPFTINRSYNDTNGSATYQASAQSSIIALEMSG